MFFYLSIEGPKILYEDLAEARRRCHGLGAGGSVPFSPFHEVISSNHMRPRRSSHDPVCQESAVQSILPSNLGEGGFMVTVF